MTSQNLDLYFRAMSHRQRLRMALYLGEHEEVSVTQLGSALRLSQPLVSWHLRMMRRAGLVRTKRTGRQVMYSLNRSVFRKYQERLNAALGLDREAPGGEQDPRSFPAGAA